MDTADRIFELLDHSPMSQKKFADSIGVPPQVVTDWKNRRSRSYVKRLPEISSTLGTTVSYLLGESSSTALPADALPADQLSALRVPVLGTIPAGIPIDAIEEILDWEDIPASWGTGGRSYYGLKVKGDSMYPKYLAGDTVILRKETVCDSGDDCAVLVNGGEATLKQVVFHAGGAIELKPLNPAYPPRTYTPAEIDALPVQIIGVVVELRRKIK